MPIVDGYLPILSLSTQMIVESFKDDGVAGVDSKPAVSAKLFEIRGPELCEPDLSCSLADMATTFTVEESESRRSG